MNTLPLEVIEYIAKLDNKTWYLLVQVYKFLSEKNDVDDMKRRFLLCSLSGTEYSPVYYLPNGDLHTFENPCETHHSKNQSYLKIWFKDNKIHRDNDEPAVIVICPKDRKYYMPISDFPMFNHLSDKLGNFYNISNMKMWFKDNNLYRDNDLPVITDISNTYKEWRKDNVLHRDNDLPAIITGNSTIWYSNGKLVAGSSKYHNHSWFQDVL